MCIRDRHCRNPQKQPGDAGEQSGVLEAVSYTHLGFEVHTEAGLTTITAHGISAHSAFPKGGQNAIQRLIKGLLSEKVLSEEDSHILQPFAEANQDYYGEAAGISYEDEVSGKLTCAGTVPVSYTHLGATCLSSWASSCFPRWCCFS